MLRRSITWESRSSRESPFGRERALKRKNKKEKKRKKNILKTKSKVENHVFLGAQFKCRFLFTLLLLPPGRNGNRVRQELRNRCFHSRNLRSEAAQARQTLGPPADPKNILQLNCELTITISFAGVAPPGVAPKLTFTSCLRLLIKNRFDFN